MHVHLVFVTKYRRELFTAEILNDLRGIFANVCTDFESELVKFDGEDDHVHLLVNLSAQSFSFRARKQPKRRLQSSDPAEKISVHSQKPVGWRVVVAFLLCRKLWRSAYSGHPSVHRTAANATLTTQDGLRRHRAATSRRAILPRPEGRGLPRNPIKRLCSN